MNAPAVSYPPGYILPTTSRSPAANTAGWRSFAPSRKGVSSQLRPKLRYQLIPPRKPACLNSFAKKSRSASVSHAGSYLGTTPVSINFIDLGKTCFQTSCGAGSPEAEYRIIAIERRGSASSSFSTLPGS